VKKVVIMGRVGGGKKVGFGEKPDRQKLTVDVTIEFK
jgi:hypothetical protein